MTTVRKKKGPKVPTYLPKDILGWLNEPDRPREPEILFRNHDVEDADYFAEHGRSVWNEGYSVPPNECWRIPAYCSNCGTAAVGAAWAEGVVYDSLSGETFVAPLCGEHLYEWVEQWFGLEDGETWSSAGLADAYQLLRSDWAATILANEAMGEEPWCELDDGE